MVRGVLQERMLNIDKYRLVSCQPQIAIFSSVKSDIEKKIYENENIQRRCQKAFFKEV